MPSVIWGTTASVWSLIITTTAQRKGMEYVKFLKSETAYWVESLLCTQLTKFDSGLPTTAQNDP